MATQLHAFHSQREIRMAQRGTTVVLILALFLLVSVPLLLYVNIVVKVADGKSAPCESCPVCENKQLITVINDNHEKFAWPQAYSKQPICSGTWTSPFALPPALTVPRTIPAELMDAFTLFGEFFFSPFFLDFYLK